MRSKSTGKIITKIVINKKTVSLYFSKERISISHDAYVQEGPLFVGKELSNKDIAKLKTFTNVTKLYNYAISLLKKNHFSEWKMREKLYLKEAKKDEVDLVIKTLKNIDLLNDEMLIQDIVEYGKDRCIGKNKIIKELSDKGIFEEKINKISFSYREEVKKASSWIGKLEKKYDKYSYEGKKSHIYASLISLGFEGEVINEVMRNVSPIALNDEINKVKKEYEKAYSRLKKRYEGKELKEKIFSYLKSKGYRYSEIKRVMEEYSYENDF